VASVEIRFDRLDVEPAEVAYLARLLDAEECERAARFRFEADRRRFIVRRGRLRERLGERTGQAPERLAFGIGPFGKPELPGGPRFSLSHSGERMMLAISDVEVGCDIERHRPLDDWRAIADRLFAPGERAQLAALDEAEGRAAFFRCWARKEAFVKALGQGLSYPLDAFEVTVGPEARLLRGGEGWRIAVVKAGSDCAAAVVTRELPLRT